MAERVALVVRDLFFRAKLESVVRAAGAEPVRDAADCDRAVVALGRADALEMITGLARRGVPVLAFGSHVDAEALRAAREAGAVAVPNSQVESALRAFLAPAG